MTRLTPTHITGVFFFLVLHLLFPATGYAYLDPETGSYGFQMLLAAGLVLFFTARAYWKKLKVKSRGTGDGTGGRGGELEEPARGNPEP